MVALITAAGLTANPIQKARTKSKSAVAATGAPKRYPRTLSACCGMVQGPGGQRPNATTRCQGPQRGGGLGTKEQHWWPVVGLGQWASTKAAWPALAIGLAGTAPTRQAPTATWVGLGRCVGTGGEGHQLCQGPGLGGGGATAGPR